MFFDPPSWGISLDNIVAGFDYRDHPCDDMVGGTFPVVDMIRDLFGFPPESDDEAPDDGIEVASVASIRTNASTGSVRAAREVLIREGALLLEANMTRKQHETVEIGRIA